MKTTDLINSLNRMKVQTGSLVCLGCGHEHNCGVHGCAIIREAAAQLHGMYTALGYETQQRKAEVDAQPVKHGKWLNAGGDWTLATCSECGEEYDVSDEPCEEHFGLFEKFYRFCPGCGAKMDMENET